MKQEFFTYSVAVERGDKKFVGHPCRKCGNAIRYVKGGQCIPCQRERCAEWTERNKDYHRQISADWAKQNKDRIADRRRARHDPVKSYAKKQAQKAADPEKFAEQRRGYLAKQKPYKPFHFSLRRHRLAAGGNYNGLKNLTRVEMDQVLALKPAGCAYCGGDHVLCLDHKTPIAVGGKHEVDNLQWLCRHHNAQKGTKTDAEYRHWASERGIKILPENLLGQSPVPEPLQFEHLL